MAKDYGGGDRTIWRSSYGGKKKDYANVITKTSDENFVAVGSSESFSEGGDLDVYVVKFDTEGKRAWQKNFGGANKEVAHGVARMADGKVLVVGETESFINGGYDFFMLKLEKR